ncbi:hypothetical protein AKJ65_00365 [candidate division MSBL1 archaeon SCGC-AAA259E19]|uniref:PIN domain-containing protein n=1 Tax=candidate division MSBL1 archaeon SCGC-AAA259E19 TaxID=1698264 RepID=A0A133UNR8_9EURY|nr:hypothetical protein AKJ65_00365 [candidate division MSBL1 archaeon SCGC-AAA259E19]
MSEKVFVLDTSGLIAGFTPNLEEPKQYTVPKVLGEARSLPVKLKLETAISSGQMRVRKPSEEAVRKVKEKVEETKDRVSQTDIQILALAEELQEKGKSPEIVTDDYAIQNLAEFLEIRYSQVAKPGISDVYEWEKECPACGRVYTEDIKRCKACGSKLRRKPKD